MRILLVHNFYQQRGGEDEVFAAEARLLEERGHDVDRFTMHNDAVREVGRLTLAARTIWNRTVAAELRERIRHHGAEVVHFHNTFPLISPAGYYAAHDAGAAVVQTLHNYRLLCANALLYREGAACELCLGRAVPLAGIARGCYRGDRAATAVTAGMVALHRTLGTWRNAVDAYIALTQLAREKFLAGGLPAERVHIKPNFLAVDPGVGRHDGGFALFVGRLSAEKGIRTLLQAWEKVGGRVPLKIVGTGPLEDLMRQPREGVEWHGRIGREEMLELMRRASFLVAPSEAYETFGLTVIEAFATGMPAIVTEATAPGELVEEGVTGLHTRAGDPNDLAARIMAAASDPVAMRRMGGAARQEYLARYTSDRNYDRLLEVYDSALRHRNGASGTAV